MHIFSKMICLSLRKLYALIFDVRSFIDHGDLHFDEAMVIVCLCIRSLSCFLLAQVLRDDKKVKIRFKFTFCDQVSRIIAINRISDIAFVYIHLLPFYSCFTCK